MRKFAYAAFALLLASLILAVPSPANAVTPPPPGAPPALNVLPSTIIGATGSLSGAGRLEVQMAYLYKFAQTPGFWQALAAHQAGTASAAQTATVGAVTSGHRIPATQLQALARTAGGTLTVVSGFQFGTAIGGGILDVIGFDRTGAVCSQTGGLGQVMVGLLTGVECTEFNEFAEGYTLNDGVSVGFTTAPICATAGSLSGVCAAITSKAPSFTQSGTTWQRYCLAVTGWAGGSMTALRLVDSVGGVIAGQTFSQPYAGFAQLEGEGGVTSLCGGLSPTAPVITSTSTTIAVGLSWSPTMRPEGGSVDIVETSANPTRTLKCVVLGTDANEYVAYTDPYTEGDGVMPSPKCPELPSGVDATTVTIFEEYGGESHQLWQEGTTPQYQEHQSSYPECAGGTCMLDLRTVAGASCFQTPTECANWFADPNKADKFNCWYGTHVVDLAECNVYGPTFKPDAQTNGTPLGDPENGTQTDAPPGANPGADKDTFGQPVKEPTEQRQCFPTGWGVLNPVEWVTKPVQCALEWAFVPRAEVVQEQADDMNEAWAQTPPFRLVAAITAWEFIAAPTGCDGVTLDLPFLPEPIQVADACPGSMLAGLAAWSRFFGNVAFAVYGAVAVSRNLARVVEFPGLGGE